MSLPEGFDKNIAGSTGNVTSRTEAPTSGATLANVVAATTAEGQKLTTDQLDFVTLVDMHWGRTGQMPSSAVFQEQYGLMPSDFDRYLTVPRVQEALRERGVKLPFPVGRSKESFEWRSKTLSPLQLLCANTMLDLIDTRSDKKKLQDLGVSTRTYQSWLRDPVFSGYMRDRAEGLIGDVQHDALLALADKVRQGDVRAIKYYHEFTGRFTESAKQATQNTQVADLQNLMIQIVEIISDEVDDPQTAARIADRFKTLITARQVVQELTNSDVVVIPQIAKSREITPELQKLMDAGVGNNE